VRRMQVLSSPHNYMNMTFGADVENRGGVLLNCEWDGGRFVSGVFMGGIFLGGIFWGGFWRGGMWEGGFDRDGIYHPRGDDPSCW